MTLQFFLPNIRSPRSLCQRQKNPVSVSASPTGKFLRISTKLAQNQVKHIIGLECFQTVWKVSGQTGKFPEDLESFRTAWKVYGQSGRFPTNLETPEVCYNMDKIIEVSHQQSLQK